MSTGLNICVPNGLGFIECPTNETTITGNILSGQAYDFTPAVTGSFWALGFSFLGNSYPFAINFQQAFLFSTLQLYNCTQINANTVQFTDSYETPNGLVQTQFQVILDHAAKKVYVQNLFTKLPQQSGFRACSEILLNYWEIRLFNYNESPIVIKLPY